MPQKEDTLKEIFKEAGAFITENELPRPNRNNIEGTNLINEIINGRSDIDKSLYRPRSMTYYQCSPEQITKDTVKNIKINA